MVYTIFVDFANFARMSPNTGYSNQGLISRFDDWPINCLSEEATVIKLNCKTSFLKIINQSSNLRLNPVI
jgi:hypothetical protein